MKVTIEGTGEEIKKVLQAIDGSEEYEKKFNDAVLEMKDKTIEKLQNTIVSYQKFFSGRFH